MCDVTLLPDAMLYVDCPPDQFDLLDLMLVDVGVSH